MVRITNCDRCHKQIKKESHLQLEHEHEEYQELSDQLFDQLLNPPNKLGLLEPQLCNKCTKQFKKLIKTFNTTIKHFLTN